MKPRKKAPGVEFELDEVRELELQLKQLESRNKHFCHVLAEQRIDRSSMLPPMGVFKKQERIKQFEQQLFTRSQVANIRREQSRGFAGFVLFSTIAAALVWWGLSLMQTVP